MVKKNIKKIALICIQDNKILLVYKKKTGEYITPGGKMEPGENDLECLIRELNEEINCSPKDLKYFNSFIGKTEHGEKLYMKCYFGNLEGQIKLNKGDSITSYYWADKSFIKHSSLSPLLRKKIFPLLIKTGYLK